MVLLPGDVVLMGAMSGGAATGPSVRLVVGLDGGGGGPLATELELNNEPDVCLIKRHEPDGKALAGRDVEHLVPRVPGLGVDVDHRVGAHEPVPAVDGGDGIAAAKDGPGPRGPADEAWEQRRQNNGVVRVNQADRVHERHPGEEVGLDGALLGRGRALAERLDDAVNFFD